ncbi:MAG: aldose epimerase family protein [Terriglobales bacterium]
MKLSAGVVAILLVSLLTVNGWSEGKKSTMQKQAFGKTDDGQQMDLYTLTNAKGMQVAITNFGGTIVSIKVPDKNGNIADVVLGYDDVSGYQGGKAYFGATIGRYGNRIAKGKFTLDGKTYQLPLNDGPNTLHGGIKGFSQRVWTAKDVSGPAGQALQLTYLSKDGEEGFPGNLHVKVVFTLPSTNELKIDYSATTDKDTVINLTNHSYFNLSGKGEGDILGTELKINASRFTPVDSTLIPTGEMRSVKGTPFDFTKSTAIGARINQDDEQLKLAGGYDHNWVLDAGKTVSLHLAAEAYDPTSGRVLEVLTTEPGVQFYTGNFLDGTIHGKGGKVYNKHDAFCLETQHFPDSPNHPKFPSTELKPGEQYHTITVFKFLTK